MSLAALGLLALGACDGPGPQETPPPPMASAPQPTQAPDLLGGPDHGTAMAPDGQPGEDADADRDDESGYTAMAPIPNPEDMTPDERHHFYGDRYAYLDQGPAAPDETPYIHIITITTAGLIVITAGRMLTGRVVITAGTAIMARRPANVRRRRPIAALITGPPPRTGRCRSIGAATAAAARHAEAAADDARRARRLRRHLQPPPQLRQARPRPSITIATPPRPPALRRPAPCRARRPPPPCLARRAMRPEATAGWPSRRARPWPPSPSC